MTFKRKEVRENNALQNYEIESSKINIRWTGWTYI